MTTENFDFKVNDVIVGNSGMGENMGYYIETKTDKRGIWVYYGSAKTLGRAVYTINIENARPATAEEAAIFEA
jgi:hypothetical protein